MTASADPTLDPGAALADIAVEAARLILPLWRSDLTIRHKADDSPVTVADQRAETLILERLAVVFPGVPVISEEDASESGVPEKIGRRFFLVDPLDGTKAFVRGDPAFTVNIALIEDGIPVAGAVVAPATGEVWRTRGNGALKSGFDRSDEAAISVRPWPTGEALALISHTMKTETLEALKQRYGFDRNQPMDSSIKLCRIAEGAADIYARHGTTMEWDIAAGHAVLAAAGGQLETADGTPFLYGKADEGFRNGWFVARGAEARRVSPPIRDPRYAPAELTVDERADGGVVLHNPKPLGKTYLHTLGALDYWAQAAPDRSWLAERSGEGWRTVSYGEGRDRVSALAGGLAALGLPSGAPLLVLARNGIEHALLAFAAMSLEIPVAAISPQYGFSGANPERLAHAAGLIAPGAVFVDDGAAFAGALDSPLLSALPAIVGSHARSGDVTLDWLLSQGASTARPRPEAIAKLLLTSGSTGRPKAVMCLHSAVAVNAAQVTACYDDPEPPVVVNQAPWSHSLGSIAILQMMLHRGGTLYIDAGAPVAGRSGETVRNLRQVAPTYHNMVPAGWDLLVHDLERDETLARTFFSRVRVLQYGGAALGQSTCDRIQAVALRTVGETISFASGYGATETGPTATNVHWPNARMGLMGLPVPGTTVKLTPVDGRLEFRVKGPQVSPGYFRDEKATAKAFDEEGFYRLGDAARPAQHGDWRRGLVFDGRLSENFKLSSGVFVNAGALRVAAVSAMGGAAADAVVCGEGKTGVGLLVFPGPGDQASRDQAVREGLGLYNASAAGSSGRVARALVLTDSPDPISGEITDKGYINQTIARSRRAAEVARLFSEPPGDGVIVV